MSFQPGEFVVCVKPDDLGELVKGRVYTVSDVLRLGSVPAVAVEEIPDRDIFRSLYLASRFRPISDHQRETVRSLRHPSKKRAGAPA